MKKSWFGLVAVLVLGLVPRTAHAQQNPVSSFVKDVVSHEGQNLVGAAQEMPPDKYAYKPTDGQMSFGQLMVHVAKSNLNLCSKISGKSAPDIGNLMPTSPKDQIAAAVKTSIDFCNASLATIDDSILNQQVTMFGNRQMSKAAAMITLTDDLADHYSQAAGYLRLNGMLPPSAQHSQM